MGALEQQGSQQAASPKQSHSVKERLSDSLIFIILLVCAVLALAAVIVAAPVALMLSALAGLVAKNRNRNDWRPASA